jgi:vanillate O-demethylase ferredoxin subunit
MADDINLVVRGIDRLTPTICRFRLGAADGRPLPLFTAGAHIKVKVALPDGRADERSYSLVNSDGQNGDYEIAVQCESAGHGGSAYMHRLKVGDALAARGPVNDFRLATGASHHVLIAGGIGITPILSMARALRAAGQPFHLHYAARSPELMAFREAVEALCDKTAQLCFDGGDPARGLNLEQVLGPPAGGRHVYVCGPKGMIDAVLATAARLGWAAANVHFESFGAAPQAGDGAIEVVLSRAGRTIMVPAQQSILDALLAAGIDHPYDCKRGECSTCQVEVLEGIPDNRDFCLFGDEYEAGKLMCVCVSRAKTPQLVLNL